MALVALMAAPVALTEVPAAVLEAQALVGQGLGDPPRPPRRWGPHGYHRHGCLGCFTLVLTPVLLTVLAVVLFCHSRMSR